jgi:hypothetical protein
VLLRKKVHKRIEEVFGCMKTVWFAQQAKLRGLPPVGWLFVFTASAYSLVRLRRLMPLPP